MAYSVRAKWVFPVDRPPIEGGVVTVDGERIVGVGAEASGDVLDLGSAAILAGLVNAHTHLEFSGLAKPMGSPGMALPDWIRLVIGERGRGDRQADAGVRGLAESRAGGVTTVGDIVTSQDHIASDLIDATFFHEVIGFSRARAQSVLDGLLDRLDSVATIGQSKSGGVRHGISPHAPYTVSPQLVVDLVALARERCMPMAMHIAESQEELELLRDGAGPFQELLEERSMWDADAIPRGSRPLDYLKMLADAPRALVIHGNYLDEEELAFLAANRERMSLVYCPRTHAYFSHATYPLAEALANGVRIALGTDSRASNPDLSLLSEMRHVARAHPTLDPFMILELGTLAGAEALGRVEEVGSLTPGKLANMVAVPFADEHATRAVDALTAILSAEDRASGVWLCGRRVDV
jgi:cytosine/adenosine deaminase-related metal-dependent hydrolase